MDFLFIGALLEEDQNRNFMRTIRRNLRDASNPLDMPIQQFVKLFRLDQPAIIDLCNTLNPHLANSNISTLNKVLATLHFYAVGSYQNAVGTNAWISLSQTSMSRIINEVSATITQLLLPEYIKFPSTRAEKRLVKQGFFVKYGFRGVVGAIDGTHINIVAPPSTDDNYPPHVYMNRKGSHSINVMLIVDANAKIIACSARFPGSVHDSAIWQMSSIRNHLEQNHRQESNYLLGDSGYPLEPWLFTPFANPQHPEEVEFNRMHVTTRNVVERANGILKGRFRCLSKQRVLMYHPIRAANIIYACCILHNIAQLRNIIVDNEEIQNNEIDANQADQPEGNILNMGRQARNQFIEDNIFA